MQQGHYYHGVNFVKDWWAVDLGIAYAIKKVMLGNRQDSVGDRNQRLEVLVGMNAPLNNPISNRDTFVLCAQSPLKGDLGEILGITCDCLTIGRHLVVQNHFGAPMQLVEVGVYGLRSDELQ